MYDVCSPRILFQPAPPRFPSRETDRKKAWGEGERGKREKKGDIIHTDRDTLMMLSDSLRTLWTHSQLCLRVRLCVHMCGLTHYCIRQALHHCQVANLEGEAASCSCNKSQKALLCLSVEEPFILTAERTNNIRLNSVLFISPGIKEDKQTGYVLLHLCVTWSIFFFLPHIRATWVQKYLQFGWSGFIWLVLASKVAFSGHYSLSSSHTPL